MSTNYIHRFRGSIQTTNSSQTTLFSYTPSAGSICIVRTHIMAMDASNNNSKGFVVGGTIKSISGSTSVAGSIDNIFSAGDLGAALWSSTIDTNGADIRIRVTGGIGSTINWACDLEVNEFVP